MHEIEGMRVPGGFSQVEERTEGQAGRGEVCSGGGGQGLTSQGLESTLAAAAPEGGGRHWAAGPRERMVGGGASR